MSYLVVFLSCFSCLYVLSSYKGLALGEWRAVAWQVIYWIFVVVVVSFSSVLMRERVHSFMEQRMCCVVCVTPAHTRYLLVDRVYSFVTYSRCILIIRLHDHFYYRRIQYIYGHFTLLEFCLSERPSGHLSRKK